MLTTRECRERAALLRARAAIHPNRRCAASYDQLALAFDHMAVRAEMREHAGCPARDQANLGPAPSAPAIGERRRA